MQSQSKISADFVNIEIDRLVTKSHTDAKDLKLAKQLCKKIKMSN